MATRGRGEVGEINVYVDEKRIKEAKPGLEMWETHWRRGRQNIVEGANLFRGPIDLFLALVE